MITINVTQDKKTDSFVNHVVWSEMPLFVVMSSLSHAANKIMNESNLDRTELYDYQPRELNDQIEIKVKPYFKDNSEFDTDLYFDRDYLSIEDVLYFIIKVGDNLIKKEERGELQWQQRFT